MSPLITMGAVIAAYTFVAWLLLRFMSFITACDREIRTMTKNQHRQDIVLLRPHAKAKKILRFRPVSP